MRGHFAQRDDHFPSDKAKAIEAKLQAMGKDVRFLFHTAGHGKRIGFLWIFFLGDKRRFLQRSWDHTMHSAHATRSWQPRFGLRDGVIVCLSLRVRVTDTMHCR